MKKSGGGGFKRSSFSKPSSSPKRPSSFKPSFKIGPKAPGVEGGPKDVGGGFAQPGGRTWGWRSRPRGGCIGSLIALVLVLICIGAIAFALIASGTLQGIFGG
jgi:hypothetical protein